MVPYSTSKYDLTVIQQWLTEYGFEIELDEHGLSAQLQVPYEGSFDLSVDLRMQLLTLKFYEGCSNCNLLFRQSFADDEQFMGLLRGNYLFDELVITKTPGSNRMMDLVLDLQTKWVMGGMGDIEPLLAAIQSAASPLFAAQNQDSRHQTLHPHCLNPGTPDVEQT